MKNKVIITKLMLKFEGWKGTYIELESNKLNILYGSSTVGKSLIFAMIAGTLGEKDAIEKIFKTHEVRENFEFWINFFVNQEEFLVKLKYNVEKNDFSIIREVWNGGNIETFFKTSEFSKYMNLKIDFPIVSAWDGMGKFAPFSDLLIPLYMGQESWKKGELSDSLKLKFKPSNRISSSLAYHLNEHGELFREINQNWELINKWLNARRTEAPKRQVIKFLNELEIDADFTKVEKWLALDSKRIELQAKIKKIKNARINGINKSKIKSDLVIGLINEKYKNEISNDILYRINNDIDGIYFALGTSSIRSSTLDRMEKELKETIEMLKSTKTFIMEDGSVAFPKKIIEKLIEKVKSSSLIKLSESEEKIVNSLTEKMKYMYYRTRDEFNEIATKKKVGLIKGYGYTINNQGGTEGLKKGYEIVKAYREFAHVESTVLLDSPFSEDSGAFGNTNIQDQKTKANVIKEFCDKNIVGLVSFVWMEGLKELIESYDLNVNFIDWKYEQKTTLSSRRMPDEARGFFEKYR